MLGSTVGNYNIQQKIGQGGMGTVYKAVHPRIGRTVAVKVLNQSFKDTPEIVTRFINEARAANDIRHEHIIDILDFGELADGTPYCIMEWLSGQTIGHLLAKEPIPTLSRTLHILIGVGEALAAAHGRGIVHRDLKPDNVYLIPHAGDPDFVKVLDFGIAKLMHPTHGDFQTKPDSVFGTPAYMSPEQCRGENHKVDQRSDIYSLGVLFYQMATGTLPFPGRVLGGLLIAHISEIPKAPREINPGLPQAIEQIILRAMQKDPALRYQTMDEMVADMRKVQATLTTNKSLPFAQTSYPPSQKDGVTQETPGGKPALSGRSRSLIIVASTAAILLGVGLLVLLLRRPAVDVSHLPPPNHSDRPDLQPPRQLEIRDLGTRVQDLGGLSKDLGAQVIPSTDPKEVRKPGRRKAKDDPPSRTSEKDPPKDPGPGVEPTHQKEPVAPSKEESPGKYRGTKAKIIDQFP